MIRIQSEIKRATLRQIAEGAKKSAATLKEAIIAAQAGATDAAFLKGRIIANTSGSGQSVGFQFSTNGFTQDVFIGLTEELIEVLDDAVAAGTPDPGTPAGTDTLFTAMCADDRLVGVRSQMGDFTALRYPVTR